jgi:toxin FitB
VSGYLLDTTAISESVKVRPNPGLAAWFENVDTNMTYISVFTVGELQDGIARLEVGARQRELERWLAFDLLPHFGRRVLAFDVEAARRWGAMLASARKRGKLLSVVDSQIAAIASVSGLKVVTRNERHFAPTGVATINPWTAS